MIPNTESNKRMINSTRELSYDVLISLVVKLLHVILSTVLTHNNNNVVDQNTINIEYHFEFVIPYTGIKIPLNISLCTRL